MEGDYAKISGCTAGFVFKSGRREKTQVTVHLLNGFQIKGFVSGFDNFTVVMDVEAKQMVVYKHAISTITPHKPIHLKMTQTEDAGEE